MSLISRKSAKLAVAGLSAAAAFGAASSAAHAADEGFKLSLKYTCVYPIVDAQPLSVDITALIPSSVQAGVTTPKFQISAVAVAGGDTASGLDLVGATQIEGSIIANSNLNYATSTDPSVARKDFPLKVPITLARQTVDTSKPTFTLTAAGSTPPVKFPIAGDTAHITVGQLDLTLSAFDAAGKPVQLIEGQDSFTVTCKVDPASQNTKLADIAITGDTPVTTPQPPITTPQPPVTTPVVVTTPQPPVTTPVVVTTPKPPVTTPVVVTTPKPPVTTPVVVTTPKPPVTTPVAPTTPSAGCASGIVNYGYNITGSAGLKSLTKGTLPLAGTIAAHLCLADGNFTGDLALNQTSGNLTALGFLPVTATVNLVPTAQVTGNYDKTAQSLKATAKVRIKLPSVKLAGIPIGGGANCQASQISTIPLNSVGAFNPLNGGQLAGSFSISNLSGCGALNGIISPLTAGSGNAIALKLARQG